MNELAVRKSIYPVTDQKRLISGYPTIIGLMYWRPGGKYGVSEQIVRPEEIALMQIVIVKLERCSDRQSA